MAYPSITLDARNHAAACEEIRPTLNTSSGGGCARASSKAPKFRRQQPIGPFIADFCCMERGLIVELDGGQHAAMTEMDARRSAYLARQGYRVMRFWNNEVLQNTEAVLESIAAELRREPLPRPSPRGRGRRST